MKKLILMLTASAALALGQNPPAPAPAPFAPGEVIRVIEVKQANPRSIWITLKDVFPGINLNDRMLVIRAPGSVADAIEEAIKKLDVPPAPSPETRPLPNIEVTIQLVYGSAQAEASVVPADLESTVRQLRTIFPYKSYRVMETQVLRGRALSKIQAGGNLPGGNSSYQFNASPNVVAGPAPRLVRLDGLELYVKWLNANGPGQFADARINTSLDAREGQKTFVGKANIANSEDALILVISPKVIE